jgi:hypothetical protein
MGKTITIDFPSRLYLKPARQDAIDLKAGTSVTTTNKNKDGLYHLHVKVDDGEHKGKEGFLSDYAGFIEEAFECDFRPSSGVGYFHIVFVPARSLLEIRVDLSLHCNQEFFPLYFTDMPPPSDWDSVVKTAFKGNTPRISEIWNEQFEFRCVVGGKMVSARPRFVVNCDARPLKAHYCVEIYDASGMTPAFVSSEESPHATGREFKARKALLPNTAAPQDLETSGRAILFNLVEGYELQISQSELFLNTLKFFAQQVCALKAPAGEIYVEAHDLKEMRETRDFLRAQKLDRYNFRAGVNAMEAGMVRVSLRAPDLDTVHAGQKGTPIFFRRHVDALIAEIDERRERGMNRPIFFAQHVLAHEFGHMLGLVDEYYCITQTSMNTLRDLHFMTPQEMPAWKRFQEHNATLMLESDDYPSAIQQNQFIQLCHRAGLLPPTFGRKTTSMMSCGTEFMVHHGVTIWEALSQLTSNYVLPTEWKISLT